MLKKFFAFIALTFIVCLLVFIIFAWKNTRDQHPAYDLNLQIKAADDPVRIHAGFAAKSITPEVPDRWTDLNNNAKYEPDKGEKFEDGNGNGKFDARWIAGFGNRRAANGILDRQWARTVILDDGQTRLAIVILDLIGFMHDDVVDVRKALPDSCKIDYAIIASTHTHEAVDMLGLWGGSYFSTGVDPEYTQFVKDQAVKSIIAACGKLRPAKFRFAQDLTGALPMLEDTRKPHIFDPGLRIIQALDAETDSTLGTLIAWANHPETLWSDNLLLSSDFPHHVREAIENGIFDGQNKLADGFGGIAVYMNGAIGGLMTTRPKTPIADLFQDTVYTVASAAKIRAQGQRLALLGLRAMQNSAEKFDLLRGIDLQVQTIRIPLQNPLFRLAAALGVIRRSMPHWLKVRSEIAAFSIGPATFSCIPGEIYPEIVNGGIETPAGQDIKTAAIEIPPLRQLMPGKYKFIIGLANDEIGYIIPQSEWDEAPPYLYDTKSSPYGEGNSMGPETARIVHSELAGLLKKLAR